jgi:hypothetical protein
MIAAARRQRRGDGLRLKVLAGVMAGLDPIGAKFRDSQLESIVIQAGDGCADV